MESKRSLIARSFVKPKPRKSRKNAKFPVTRSVFDYKFSLRDAGNLAAYAYRGASALVNPEHKFINVGSTSAAVSQSGTFVLLSAIGESSDWNGRDGRSVRLVSRYFAFTAEAVASDAIGHVVRIVIYRDLAGQGAHPSVSDLIETAGSSLVAISPINPVNEKRFQILHDIRVVINTVATPRVTGVVGEADNQHVLFLGTTAAIADCGIGAVSMLYCSDVTGATPPTLSYYSQLRYIDN